LMKTLCESRGFFLWEWDEKFILSKAKRVPSSALKVETLCESRGFFIWVWDENSQCLNQSKLVIVK
ncbi:MAG TPA: hypothetical protein PLI68_02410, partial [Bacteroidia bacterium]|nr:hypothetical protein [Bacteroidia bacterium]